VHVPPAWGVRGARVRGVGRRSASAPPGAARGTRRRGRSASAPAGAALRAVSVVAFGNEGEDPGAWCALSRATCRRARSFATPWRAIGPTSSDSPRYPGRTRGGSRTTSSFSRFPGETPGGSAIRGQHVARHTRRATNRAHKGHASLLASLPHCQNATSSRSGERRPLARTPQLSPAPRTRPRSARPAPRTPQQSPAPRTPSDPRRSRPRPATRGPQRGGAGGLPPPTARITPPSALNPPPGAQNHTTPSDVRPVSVVERS
jgi:hypothetical protein